METLPARVLYAALRAAASMAAQWAFNADLRAHLVDAPGIVNVGKKWTSIRASLDFRGGGLMRCLAIARLGAPESRV
jgi:hypothetical protein